MAKHNSRVREVAKQNDDTYELETVMLLKHLSNTRHLKEARSLGSQLFADHDASPDVAASLDLLADEIWYLWRSYHEIRNVLLKLTSERAVLKIFSASTQ